MKRTLVTVAAVMLGNIVFEKFIAKTDDNSGGFIQVAPGIGLDDVARAATIVGALFLSHKFIGG